jgi:hypothetical protein
MEVEEFGVGLLGVTGERELGCGWNPLGGEDERGVEGAGVLCGFLDLLEGEVVDGGGADGVVGVAEVGVLEFGGGGPGGEDGGVGEVVVDEADGALVERDEVAVGEVVLGGEAIGRIDEEGCEETCCGEGGERGPLLEALMPLGGTDEQDERVHGEQVASEKRAAEDGERDGVGKEDDGDGDERMARKTGFAWERFDGQNGQGAGDGDPHIHVEEEVDEAMPEAEEDARGREVRGGVVAKKFGVAEGEAGDVVVVRVPEDEGEDGEGEGSE